MRFLRGIRGLFASLRGNPGTRVPVLALGCLVAWSVAFIASCADSHSDTHEGASENHGDITLIHAVDFSGLHGGFALRMSRDVASRLFLIALASTNMYVVGEYTVDMMSGDKSYWPLLKDAIVAFKSDSAGSDKWAMGQGHLVLDVKFEDGESVRFVLPSPADSRNSRNQLTAIILEVVGDTVAYSKHESSNELTASQLTSILAPRRERDREVEDGVGEDGGQSQ